MRNSKLGHRTPAITDLAEFIDSPHSSDTTACFHQQQGIGTRLVNFACEAIKESGARQALALSTQSFRFFEDICGFKEANVDALPEARRKAYISEKRNSKILVKEL